MQIDFHHAVTYVIARLAGFEHPEANIVAYCAEYVDDATNSGTIKFDNKAMYYRINSAHKMLDYRNREELANHRVWIPFHFLPGNGMKPAGEDPDGTFIEKLVCKPNSPIARDMVDACIRDKNKLYGLHLLGITMHVYADTWAHQGFAGVNHRINDASEIHKDGERDTGMMDKLKNWAIGNAFPLGHGSVLSYPDRPYLNWGYTNDYYNDPVVRDNPTAFLDAAEHMCRAMQRFRGVDVTGLPSAGKTKLDEKLRSIQHEEGEDRHKEWLEAIENGEFDFGSQILTYTPKGRDSWKEHALSTEKEEDHEDEVFPYKPEFLGSNWKLFHDALQAHRFRVLHDILPRYNICAA